MADHFFPLHPQHLSSGLPQSPTQPDAQATQQPTLSAKLLFERTAFVGQSFAEDDLDTVEFFKQILTEMGVRPITGERAEARSVSDKVKARIAQAEIFVGVLTRREEVDGGKYRTSEWVVQEIAYAAGLGKKIIVLKEKDVLSGGGIHGDAEYVEFDRSQLHKAALKLIQMIWSLNPGKVAFNKNQSPHMSIEVLEAAVAAQPREPLLRVTLAQVRASSGQVENALRELRELLLTFPDFAPARLELIKGLRTIGRHNEAEQEVRAFIATQPFNGQAHHHLAHVLEAKKNYSNAVREFELAQQYEPGNATNFRCCGILRYRTAGGNRKKLLDAKADLETASELGGQSEAKNCEAHLHAVKRALKKAGRSRTSSKSRERRKRR